MDRSQDEPLKRGARAELALSGVAGALLLVSLLVRVVGRGPYSPGFDFLGPAHGLYLLETRSPWGALGEMLRLTRDFSYWNHTNSLVYTLLGGGLSRLLPWEYWAHLLTAAQAALTLFAVARLGGVSWRSSHVLLLAFAASPTLVSLSLAGYPYATGFLPHALALLVLASPRLRQRPWATLALALLVNQSAWWVYEHGKTALVVWAAAALFEREAGWRTRLAWAAAALALLVELLLAPGANLRLLLVRSQPDAQAPLLALRALLPSAGSPLDLPLLLAAGLCCAPFLRRLRGPILAGLAAQLLSLVVVAGLDAGSLRPRRFASSAWFALLVIVLVHQQWRERSGAAPRLARRALLAALLAGAGWQLADAAIFYSVPVARRSQPLPFTSSPRDYRVAPLSTAFAAQLRARALAGQRLLLLYGAESQAELPEDPAALLERLHLSLGSARFRAQVSVFTDAPCHFSCVPARPLRELPGFLDTVADGRAGFTPDELLVVYKSEQLQPRAAQEANDALAAIGRRFLPRPEPDPLPGFSALRLERRALGRGGFAGLRVAPGSEVFTTTDSAPALARRAPAREWPLDLALMLWPGQGTRFAPPPFGARPFRYEWSGTLEVCRGGIHEVVVASEGVARVRIDGRELLRSGGVLFRVSRAASVLERGAHALELSVESPHFAPDAWGPRARLAVEVVRAPEAWAGPVDPAECGPRREAQATRLRPASLAR